MLYRRKKLEPSHLNDEPTHCHWCTGMLRGLRNIYKGQNCSRHYCSEGCLRAGEERASRYAIAGAPTLAFMQKLQPKWRDGSAL